MLLYYYYYKLLWLVHFCINAYSLQENIGYIFNAAHLLGNLKLYVVLDLIIEALTQVLVFYLVLHGKNHAEQYSVH